MSIAGGSTSPSRTPQEQKYIPPGRRSSSDGSVSDTQASTTSKETRGANTKRKGSSRNSSPRRPCRSPSPNGQPKAKSDKTKARQPSPGIQRDKPKSDQVEIWQEKRKGGNRAPKIEPEGTKTWRTPTPAKVQPKITLLKRDLNALNFDSKKDEDFETSFPFYSLPNHPAYSSQSPLSRWPEYPAGLLDVIDMHLNVLIQCISPGEPRHSFRFLLAEHRKGLSAPVLPRGMFRQDFENLAKAILEGVLRLPSSALQYLLKCEEEVGNRSWSVPRQLDSQLYGLAVAQMNDVSTRKVLGARFGQIPEEQRNLLISREYLLAQEQESIMSYVVQHNASHPRDSLLTAEMQQLVRDCQNGTLAAEHLATWNTCLSYHWLGRVQTLPDYPALLQEAGFEVGKRTPAQLIHPKESRLVFDTVAAWMQRIRLEEQLQVWSYPLPLQQVSSSLNNVEWKEQVIQDTRCNEYAIDFAKRLSLNRNWRNQFML